MYPCGWVAGRKHKEGKTNYTLYQHGSDCNLRGEREIGIQIIRYINHSNKLE